MLVDHAVGAPFGDLCQVAHGDTDGVALDADKAGVAVAGAHRFAARVDYRVVAAGIYFGHDRLHGVVDGLARRAVRLRHTAQRERVLKVFAAVFFKEGALREDLPQMRGGRGLFLVGLHRHHPFIEGLEVRA